MPFVRAKAKDVPFLLGFLDTIERHIAARSESSPWPEAAIVYRDLAGLVAPNLNLSTAKSLPRITAETKAFKDSCFSWPEESRIESEKRALGALDTGELCLFAKSLIILQLPDTLEAFNNKLASDAALIPAIEFHDLWLPFIKELISIQVNDLKMDLATSPYFRACRALLLAYINNFVGREPESSPNAERGGLHFVLNGSYRRKPPAHEAWRDRAAQATARLAQFQQDELKVLLGEQYESMVRFEHLKIATRGSGTAGQGSVPVGGRETMAAASDDVAGTIASATDSGGG